MWKRDCRNKTILQQTQQINDRGKSYTLANPNYYSIRVNRIKR